MTETVTVGPIGDLPENEGTIFRAGERQLALFRDGDRVRAIDNTCPHAGAALAYGYVEGDSVSCPWHCWAFDLDTGKCATVEGADVEVFEVTVTAGVVSVLLPD